MNLCINNGPSHKIMARSSNFNEFDNRDMILFVFIYAINRDKILNSSAAITSNFGRFTRIYKYHLLGFAVIPPRLRMVLSLKIFLAISDR